MTRIADLLGKVTRLGFDTSPLIYFVERHPVYLTLMRYIISQVDEGTLRGYSSVITLTEMLVHPKLLGATTLEQHYRELLRNSRHFELVPIDAMIAEQAAELRARYNLRTPDALHIAAALSADCQAFLTNDKKLKSVTDIEIWVLDDLLTLVEEEGVGVH